MIKPRIGIDIDGTIANTPQSMINSLIEAKILPSNTSYSDIKWNHLEYNRVKKTGFPGLTLEETGKLFSNPEF